MLALYLRFQHLPFVIGSLFPHHTVGFFLNFVFSGILTFWKWRGNRNKTSTYSIGFLTIIDHTAGSFETGTGNSSAVWRATVARLQMFPIVINDENIILNCYDEALYCKILPKIT